MFNERADIGPFLEVIARTAFDAVLADPATDVRAFLDHDSGKLLGRQSSSTLRLSQIAGACISRLICPTPAQDAMPAN
nr:HK97 family phage prohead protease [Mycolicibacterium komossense]